MNRTKTIFMIILTLILLQPLTAQLANTGGDNMLDDVDFTIAGSVGLWLSGPSDLSYYSWWLDKSFSTEKDESSGLVKLYLLGHISRGFVAGFVYNATSFSTTDLDIDGDVSIPGVYIGWRFYFSENIVVQPAVEVGMVTVKVDGDKFEGVSVNMDMQIQYALNENLFISFDPGFISIPYAEHDDSGDHVSCAPITFINVGVGYSFRLEDMQ